MAIQNVTGLHIFVGDMEVVESVEAPSYVCLKCFCVVLSLCEQDVTIESDSVTPFQMKLNDVLVDNYVVRNRCFDIGADLEHCT